MKIGQPTVSRLDLRKLYIPNDWMIKDGKCVYHHLIEHQNHQFDRYLVGSLSETESIQIHNLHHEFLEFIQKYYKNRTWPSSLSSHLKNHLIEKHHLNHKLIKMMTPLECQVLHDAYCELESQQLRNSGS